jgi:MFS family permease
MTGHGARHLRALPLAGLAVMVLAGVVAGPYTPSWFDGTEACTRAPCPVDVDPQLALRVLSWATWGGLLLVVAGAGLAAALLARREEGPTGPATAGSFRGRRALLHSGTAGVVTAVVVTVGASASLMAGLAASSQLALAAAVGAWLGLGRLLELVHRGLGRARGAATAYLLSLVVAGLSGLAMATVLVAREAWWAGVGTAGLVASVVTGLSGTVAWDRWPAVRALGGVVTTAAAVTALVGSLSLLDLLRPMERPTAGADLTDTTSPQASPRPTGPPATTPGSTPSPTTTDRGVRTGLRCSAADLRLGLTGFDAAMGARVATLEATNVSGHPCYMDGFATVALSQGRSALDLRSGTTSTSQPGMEGRASRVGLAPRDTARAVLYWRGFGAAADTTTPQTLTVTLHPGSRGQPVTVEPYAFDLADGGELRVGNWVLAG